MKSCAWFSSLRTPRYFCLVAAVCALSSRATSLSAQPPEEAAPAAKPAAKYVELKVDKKTEDRLARYGARNGTVDRILRGSEVWNAQNKQLLTDYYTRYFFTRMTHIDKLDQLLATRDKLDEDFERCRTPRVKDVRDYLNALTTELMFGIVYGPRRAIANDGREAIVFVRPNEGDMRAGLRIFALDGKEIPANEVSRTTSIKEDFHPAVKYNAMLILGQLNNEVGLGGKDAVPRVEVLRPLLANIARNPNAPDYLRVGALLTIARHVELTEDLPPAIQALIADTMLGIVNEPLAIGRKDGQIWLKQQAVDILGMLGFLGNDGAVVEQMAKVISDAKQPLPLRYATANAIGRMRLTAPPKMSTDNLLQQLGQLAADACREELYLAQSRNQKLSRSRVLDRLKSVQIGLDGSGGENGGSGIATVLDAAQANFAQKLRDQINDVWNNVVAATSEKEIAATLSAGADGLEGLLQATTAPAAATKAPPAATDAPLPPLGGQPEAEQPKAAAPQVQPKRDSPF